MEIAANLRRRILRTHARLPILFGLLAAAFFGLAVDLLLTLDRLDRADRRVVAAQSRGWAILAAATGASLPLGAFLALTSGRRLARLFAAFQAATDDLQARIDRLEVERLGLLSEAMKQYAIFKLDWDGRISSWDEESERLLGYRTGEILGRRPSCFFEADQVTRDALYHDLEWAALQGQVAAERTLVRKDGFRFRAHVTLVANRQPDGTIRDYTNVIHEVEAR